MCDVCNRYVAEGSRFCCQCGAKVSEELTSRTPVVCAECRPQLGGARLNEVNYRSVHAFAHCDHCGQRGQRFTRIQLE